MAEAIRSRAIRTEDGSAAWIAPQYLVQAERYQLQPMDYNLYGGTWRRAVSRGRRAIRPRVRLRRAGAGRPPPAAKRDGPPSGSSRRDDGYRRSVGPRLGRVLPAPRKPPLDEPALLEDAHRSPTSSPKISSPPTGVRRHRRGAGALLSLLALYEASPDRRILERAIACGEHLIEARTATDAGLRAWVTDEGLRTTGFSHGTAGIAYALLRLYEHTRDARFLEAAEEAIAYEDTQYSPENRNWVDFGAGRAGLPVAVVPGAPGIGLARLGGLGVLDTEQVREDIDLAVQTTLEFGVQGGSSLLRQPGPDGVAVIAGGVSRAPNWRRRRGRMPGG